MGSFTVYIPAKGMNTSDLEVALQSIELFSSSVSPKHQARIELRIPMLPEQLDQYQSKLTWPIAAVHTAEEQVPNEDMFLFFPSQFSGFSEVANYHLPVIGFQSKQIRHHFRHEGLMLVDSAVQSPEKVFARTLRMLYFDPGAQRMLRKNLKVQRQREAMPRLTSPLARILLSN
jgi:hypothetical protein